MIKHLENRADVLNPPRAGSRTSGGPPVSGSKRADGPETDVWGGP